METLSNGNHSWRCDLLALNYRELQTKARELQLPGNLKHKVLVEIIKARWSGDEELVEKILSNEKDTRAKKKAAKKLLEYSTVNNTALPFTPSPQVKRVGRPRKKTVDDSFSSYRDDQTAEYDYEARRSLPLVPGPSCPPRNNVPIPHSIQQLLMDRSVPNAATKQNHSSSHTHRYMFKSVHRSVKDSAGGQKYTDTCNRQVRRAWENGSSHCNTTACGNASQNNGSYDYSNMAAFQVDNIDPNTNDYLPDLDGLLGNNTSLTSTPLSGSSSQPLYTSSQCPPIFLRQDLWPAYQDNNASMTYQQQTFPQTPQFQDYNWPAVWNAPQFTSCLPNTTGYSEVVISETQNSDTLSAPELPEPVVVGPATHDNQVYWSKPEANTSLPSGTTLTSCTSNQSISNNEITAEKTGLSHMRVSVVDTQEWTYEYSTSGLFTQPFLHTI